VDAATREVVQPEPRKPRKPNINSVKAARAVQAVEDAEHEAMLDPRPRGAGHRAVNAPKPEVKRTTFVHGPHRCRVCNLLTLVDRLGICWQCADTQPEVWDAYATAALREVFRPSPRPRGMIEWVGILAVVWVILAIAFSIHPVIAAALVVLWVSGWTARRMT